MTRPLIGLILAFTIATSASPTFAGDADYKCDDGSTARLNSTDELIIEYAGGLLIDMPMSADLKKWKLYGRLKTISGGCTPDSSDPVCGASYFDDVAKVRRVLFVVGGKVVQCSGEVFFEDPNEDQGGN